MERKKEKSSWFLWLVSGLKGLVVGGFLIPVILYFVFVALGDTGGPWIWPAFAFIGGFVGLFIGLLCHKTEKKNDDA